MFNKMYIYRCVFFTKFFCKKTRLRYLVNHHEKLLWQDTLLEWMRHVGIGEFWNGDP